MSEHTQGIQGAQTGVPTTQPQPLGGLQTADSSTALEVFAASPTTTEALLGPQQMSLSQVVAMIRQTPAYNPQALLSDGTAAMDLTRLGLLNRMEALEATRQQLLTDYEAGNHICTALSQSTLPGLEQYITDYNNLSDSVNFQNGLVHVGNVRIQMQALPFQLVGSVILGTTAMQSGYSMMTNPAAVDFGADFLSSLSPGTTPSISPGGAAAVGATCLYDTFANSGCIGALPDLLD